MTAGPQRDLVTATGLLFEAAAYAHRAISDDVERATGLPGTWFEVLLRLHRTPGGALRISDIAAQVSFPPSSFSRLADRMEADGLVERAPDPAHRRATLLCVTPAGEKRLAEAELVHQPSLRTRFADLLTDTELDTLEIIARKLRDANRLPVTRPAPRA
jgi:MarR family transcriptional regulator, 2-MHQ and catechol-resistance regulon repressor